MPANPKPVMHVEPRSDLEKLPSETLYAIARNDAAQYRDLALSVLVERGSDYAQRDDVGDRARELVLNDPTILKRINSASAIISMAMSGVIECIADGQKKRVELAQEVYNYQAANARRVSVLESIVSSNHVASAQALAEGTEALDRAQRLLKHDIDRQLTTLESTLNENKVAIERALREACITIWKYFADQQWRLSQEYEEQALAFDAKLAELRAERDEDIRASNEGLRLLERSPWRKFADWSKKNVHAARGWFSPLT